MPKFAPFFANKLTSWYLIHKRDLPWRGSDNPYYIWLSEIILQQTRVAQGLPYYLKFVEAFPTVEALANASETDVLKLWQGLGYYSRARNLHFTANYIVNTCNGVFPKDYQGLVTLKGVGDYTASAIASICYNEPTAVVDGNVYRVLSRVFGVHTPINSTQGKKEFKSLAQQLLDESQPGTYNQALMEFGARYCVPQNPECSNCIFNDRCEAYKTNAVGQLPVKLKKRNVKKRYFNYIVILSENDKTLLQKRTGKGIWQGLYEFPLLESTSEINEFQLKEMNAFQELAKKHQLSEITLYNETSVIHKLSHQHLYTRFWIGSASEKITNSISIKNVKEYAVPVLLQNFITEFFSS
ncbi:A/G-specific adenine glycosylase [Jejudonia soesokkakensis]|uniref:Adenine DNA glycosylase n=1 Tax=Jejudonia soesokkakensis TaxID=1323432 RepID=A0ABW2MSZ6_9FLAO